MRCVKCHIDNNLKDRANGTCKSCRHPFTFDPRKNFGDVFNDKLFEKSIALISVNDTLKFTPTQYYYFLNSMKAVNPDTGNTPGCLLIGVAIICFFIGVINTNVMMMVTVPIVVALIGVALLPSTQQAFGAKPRPRSIKVMKSTVTKAFERWEANNEPVKSVLPDPAKMLPRGDVAKELLEYSFDRLIVTETDDIAHFLIANNFHFENNCAVLSVNFYPRNLFDTIMMMLKNNPDLKVYALHNCSWAGIAMLDRLRYGKDWFKDQPNVKIIDLGLLPRQLEKRRAFIETTYSREDAARVPKEWKAALTKEEIEWLDKGNMVTLESIPPQRLLKMISMGIALSKDPNRKDALVSVGDTESGGSGGDGGIFFFSGDSFG